MRIALLSFEYPPETGFGGIGTYSWYHARALAKLGHEVHVLAGSLERAGMRHEEHDGVRVHRIRSSGRHMGLVDHLDRLSLTWTKNRLQTAISMFEGMRQLTQLISPDIIEMPECGAEGLLVNRLVPIPSLIRLHSPAELIMPYYEITRVDLRCCAHIERLAIKAADFLSCCSEYLVDQARAHLGIRKPIEVIPNGIDLELFDNQQQIDVRDRFEIPRACPIILFAGRMERRKGIHLCADIAQDILERFEVAFVFAGHDSSGYLQRLRDALDATRLKGSAHFVGRLGLNEVRSCVSQSDIFFFPSIWENHPYSCLEAMASAKAIVSTDCGGMPEMIHHGENGLLASSGDTASYIAALETLIEDVALRRRLGDAARRSVEANYRDTEIARRAVQYYEHCLNGSATR